MAKKKDYYRILGVDRKASQKEIKDAYRRLVVTCHPDKAPDADKERFLEIQEAYETLADKKKRKRYNQELERQERIRSGLERTVSPRPVSRNADFGEFGSSLDQFFDFLEEAFFGPRRSFAQTREDYHVEIILSEEEAQYGGVLPLNVPVYVACSACRGSGWRRGGLCPHCQGSGRLRRERTVNIEIPAGIQDGSVYAVPLEEIGLSGAHLVIHFRIGG